MPKYVVRYGVMRTLGVLSSRASDRYGRGTQVIARTPRGLEAGEVLCEATEAAVSRIKNPGSGHILRDMSDDDHNELSHMKSQQRDEFKICETFVEKIGLKMQLVDLEHVFGGERIVIYYLAEDRVDFRELVRQLASEFQTRIEMRQIGVRDEAKLLADYGDCGKPVCCNTHLSEMPPVSMKMAKLQKATLDPNKISGRCGRLKCCLRYEYETYEELEKDLPPVGSDVLTQSGRGRVIGREILAGQILIESEDHSRKLIDASEVITVLRRESRKSGHRRQKGESGSKNSEDPASLDDPGSSDDAAKTPPADELPAGKDAVAEQDSTKRTAAQPEPKSSSDTVDHDTADHDAAAGSESSDSVDPSAADRSDGGDPLKQQNNNDNE